MIVTTKNVKETLKVSVRPLEELAKELKSEL